MENKKGWTLVTGGCKGLGECIVRTIARNGFPVVIHYNKSFEEAVHLMRDCRAMGVESEVIQGDFSSFESTRDFIERYLAKFTDTQNVVNNVGSYIIKKGLETTLDDSYYLFQTNFHTPFAIIRALIPSIERYRGKIINIGTSGLNSLRVDSNSPIYHSSKAALWSLTKALAKECAEKGICINMVSPGKLKNSIDLQPDWSTFPMKRPGTIEEVARVVEFLLEEENTYITGQNIEVAGGLGL